MTSDLYDKLTVVSIVICLVPKDNNLFILARIYTLFSSAHPILLCIHAYSEFDVVFIVEIILIKILSRCYKAFPNYSPLISLQL